MPVSLPYLASNKNVGALFEKIASAKIPPKFTHEFLTTTIGLKGNNDRPLITLLRTLGFLDQSGTPTEKYALLKNSDMRKAAVASGIREAYAPLFAANELAHALSPEKLKGLVSQVAGTDADMTARIASTFAALTKEADFQAAAGKEQSDKEKENDEQPDADLESQKNKPKGLRPEFHYNIQIQLPSNGTEETYLNIFNAIRKTFQ